MGTLAGLVAGWLGVNTVGVLLRCRRGADRRPRPPAAQPDPDDAIAVHLLPTGGLSHLHHSPGIG